MLDGTRDARPTLSSVGRRAGCTWRNIHVEADDDVQEAQRHDERLTTVSPWLVAIGIRKCKNRLLIKLDQLLSGTSQIALADRLATQRDSSHLHHLTTSRDAGWARSLHIACHCGRKPAGITC